MFHAPGNDIADRSFASPETALHSVPPAFAPQPATAAARRQARYAGLQRTFGNQAVHRMLSASTPTIQRKCACEGSEAKCDECRKHEPEGLLQRKASAAAPLARVPAIVREALRSPGEPLDPASRAFFEPRFGADLSHVRIHTGPSAAESSRAINALAYAAGPNIVFGRAQFAPATTAGKALLAHELAHTLQQSEAPAAPPSAISHPSDASEREADAAAASVLAAGQPTATVPLHAGGAPVQRFASEEHVKIGDIVAPGQTVVISGYGDVRLGEMIAMAGDYFESLDQIENLARSQRKFDKDQIDLVRWKVNGSAGPKPAVGAGVEQAVETRYQDLASRNQTHFSTGSTPGNSNKERYIDLHTKAIEAGYLAGEFAAGKISGFPRHIPEALEGFAQHFLTDAFSAGHVRTPRGELQTYWAGKFPNFQKDLLEFISCNMSTYIHDVDHPTALGRALSVGMINDGVHLPLFDRDGVRDTVKSLAGDKLNRFSLGDLISKALHDADSKGLDVTSASDVSGGTKPFKWRAVGDEKLFPPTPDPAATMTQNMVEAAVKFSLDEEKQAVNAGMGVGSGTWTAMTNPASYRALPLIPGEDTSSKTNVTYAWKVNDVRSLPTNVKDAIKDEFKPKTAITSGLNDVAVDRCRDTIHSGAAWDCFKQVLFTDPIEALAEVSESKTCPPSNPCPSLAAGPACP